MPGQSSSTRWCYNALHALHALQLLDGVDKINRSCAIDFLMKSQNYDGGFGYQPRQLSDVRNTYKAVFTLE